MPYRFEFDQEHRILLVVFEGDVDNRDMETVNGDIRTHVSKLNPSAGISDFSAITAFSAASQTVREAAAQQSPYPQETPRFLVAPADHMFGIARMYELVSNRPHLKVVRSRAEALAILGVRNPDSKFERLP